MRVLYTLTFLLLLATKPSFAVLPLTTTAPALPAEKLKISTSPAAIQDDPIVGFAGVAGEGYPTTTGGAGGPVRVIRTLAELETWAASRENKTNPEIVHISGRITATASTVVTVKHGANVSVLGVGSTAELVNVGLNFRNYKNVIVRNLKIREVFYPNDALSIDECQHVWVDHNEFHSQIGAGIGVDTYDGLLDIKNGSRYVTVSYNHFHDHMKNVLIGHTDNANAEPVDREIRVTFHHNFFENTDGRNPSLRWGAVHFFNNYLSNITDYGLALRQGAHALVENNVYENVKLPISTNKFDGEGIVCERGNLFTGTSGSNVITRTDCAWWDAATLPYAYTLEPAATVASTVPGLVGVGKVNVTGETGEPITYALSLATIGEGSVSPASGTHPSGTTVTLTTTPATGWAFSAWTGDVESTQNPLVLTMDNNKALTAVFVVDNGTGNASRVRIGATATPATGLCGFDGDTRDPGDGLVINLPNTAGRGVTWKVEMPGPGTYTLTWRYAGGGSAAVETAKLLVNGTTVRETVDFPKPKDSRTYLVTAPLAVNLARGVNEIRIETTQAAAFADLAWLEVAGENLRVPDCAAAIGSGGAVPTGWGPGAEPAAGQVQRRVYPNPFRGVTTFAFQIPQAGPVHLTLYSLGGAKVDEQFYGPVAAGPAKLPYTNHALKPGVYLYVVRTTAAVLRGSLLVE